MAPWPPSIRRMAICPTLTPTASKYFQILGRAFLGSYGRVHATCGVETVPSYLLPSHVVPYGLHFFIPRWELFSSRKSPSVGLGRHAFSVTSLVTDACLLFNWRSWQHQSTCFDETPSPPEYGLTVPEALISFQPRRKNIIQQTFPSRRHVSSMPHLVESCQSPLS